MLLQIGTCLGILLSLKSVIGNNECNEKPLFCDDHEKYRTINGSCNNLDVPYLGKYNRPYKRVLPNSFGDGIYSLTKMRSGDPLPLPRVISNLLFPAGKTLNKRFTLALMQMGQLVAHDLSLNGPDDSNDGCCTANQPGPQSATNDRCADINIPDDDPDYKASGWKCVGLKRTKPGFTLGCPATNLDSKVSIVTSYLDLSIIYGNNEEQLTPLRSNLGGLLKVKNKNGYNYPRSGDDIDNLCPRVLSKDEPCYLVGDTRLNQNPQLTSLHIVFYNEHNRIAKELANFNPGWDDEKLFQEARRINIAQYQHIVFNEILVKYIGKKNMVKRELLYREADSCCIDDYDSSVDPTINIEFATAGYRYFHTLIVGELQLYNKRRELVGVTTLSDYMNRPIIQELNSTYNIHNLVRGLTIQPHAEIDAVMDHDTKCNFFQPTTEPVPGSEGLGDDLVSIDLQRNRDHGVGRYVEAREWCGLSVPSSWHDLAGIIRDSDIAKLKHVYKTVDNIELYVGGFLEKKKVSGSMMGETFHCIVTRQFYHVRKGDRFFYENCENAKFTRDQLKSIKKASLARILCDNTNIDTIQPRVTELIEMPLYFATHFQKWIFDCGGNREKKYFEFRYSGLLYNVNFPRVYK